MEKCSGGGNGGEQRKGKCWRAVCQRLITEHTPVTDQTAHAAKTTVNPHFHVPHLQNNITAQSDTPTTRNAPLLTPKTHPHASLLCPKNFPHLHHNGTTLRASLPLDRSLCCGNARIPQLMKCPEVSLGPFWSQKLVFTPRLGQTNRVPTHLFWVTETSMEPYTHNDLTSKGYMREGTAITLALKRIVISTSSLLSTLLSPSFHPCLAHFVRKTTAELVFRKQKK